MNRQSNLWKSDSESSILRTGISRSILQDSKKLPGKPGSMCWPDTLGTADRPESSTIKIIRDSHDIKDT